MAPASAGWRINKLDDLPLYAADGSAVVALVARDKRLLRLPLHLPTNNTGASGRVQPRKSATKTAKPADTMTLTVANAEVVDLWLDAR